MWPLTGWYCRKIGGLRIQAPVVWRGATICGGRVGGGCLFIWGGEGRHSDVTTVNAETLQMRIGQTKGGE